MVVQSINLVADLRNQNKNIGVLYIATGLVTGGDNNGGVFWWNPSSTAADDGVDVIQVTGTATGRWVRITDDNNSVPSSRTLTINGTTFDLSANRTWNVGTVTSVAALTIGTAGTDLSSSVANGTTTPVITLNVPSASASNRGVLTSTDWTTFNNKVGGTGVAGQVAYWNGTNSETGSNNLFWDNANGRLGIGLVNPQRVLEVHSTTPDSHLRLSGSAPSVSLGDSIIGGLYQAKFGLATANGQYAAGASAGDFVILSQTGATIFMTNALEGMRLTTGGNLLLGTTVSAGEKLLVNGLGSFTNLKVTTFSSTGGMVYADSNKQLGTLNGVAGTIAYWFSDATISYLPTSTYPSLTELSYVKGVTSAIQTQIDSKQNIITNPVTGTGTINVLPKWTSTSALGNSILDDDGVSASVALTAGGKFNIKYLSAIKLALTGGTTFGSIDIPVGLDFLIRPDSIEKLRLSSTGLLKLAQYGSGSVTGTRTYTLGVDASGNVIEVTDAGLTSVGLSMPAAFSVANTPLTSNGTLAVTAVGTSAQYIRGDGQLANFPSNGGGGSAFNYYLNGSVNQGTFGGDTYYEMSKTPVLGAGTNFTRTNAQGNGYIASFITDAGDPSLLNIPGGNWNVEFYFNASSVGGAPQFYAELYKVNASNVFTLVASGSANPEGIDNGTAVDQYFTSIPVPQTSLLVTDRLAVRIYVIPDGRNITLHTENSNLCEVLTTFSTGLNALNGLTAQVQYFAVGTSGTDFAISSATDTHTFNIPDASVTARGLITTGAQTIAGAKTFSSSPTIPALYLTNMTAGSGALYYGTGDSRLTLANYNAGGILMFEVNGGSYAMQLNADLTARFNGYTTNGFVKFSSSNGTLIVDTSTYLTTSSASSTYVPYTGATTNVNLGDNNITSRNVRIDGFSGSEGGALAIKQYGATTFGPDGYTSLSALSQDTLNIHFTQLFGNAAKRVVLSTSLISFGAVRTYSLPNASGTVALTSDIPSLSGYVTGTGTTNYLPKWTSGTAIGNSLLQEGTNAIGLGVTSSAWGSTYKVLQFPGGYVGADSTLVMGLGQNFYWNGSANIYVNNGFASDYYQYLGQHVWRTAASGTAGGTIAFTQAMTLTAGGNLQLGTTSGGNWRFLCYQNASTGSATSSAFMARQDGTDDIAQFWGGGSVLATIKNNGNFLLGSTVDSGERLQVSGAGKISSSDNDYIGLTLLNTNNNASIATSSAIKLGITSTVGTHYGTFKITENTANDNTADFTLLLPFGGVESTKLTVLANGNVGIGTTTPAYLLDVLKTTVGSIAQFIVNDGTYNPRLLINGTAEGVQLFATYSTIASNLMFGTGYTERMRITGSGNLLVGSTTDTGEKLVVSGSAKVSGKLIVNHSSTDYIAEFINTSSSTPYGVIIKDAASAANNYPLFHIVNNAATVEYFRVNSGTGAATFSSSVTATSFIKSGGTSSQYLMADGSVTTGGGGGSVDELQVALICQVFG